MTKKKEVPEKLTLQEQADKIMAKAEEKGVSTNFFFITTVFLMVNYFAAFQQASQPSVLPVSPAETRFITTVTNTTIK